MALQSATQEQLFKDQLKGLNQVGDQNMRLNAINNLTNMYGNGKMTPEMRDEAGTALLKAAKGLGKGAQDALVREQAIKALGAIGYEPAKGTLKDFASGKKNEFGISESYAIQNAAKDALENLDHLKAVMMAKLDK